MDKASKFYEKALKEYYKANIDKSFEFCERSISESLKNPAALNLKGLLLYLKGDLEGAKGIWLLNKDFNKDKVSKKYLEVTEKDEKRKLFYDSAINLIKEMRIKEAIGLLRDCEESDFNSINVGNALAICLIRQGKYNEAEVYINKVLSIDNKNNSALENRKMLIEYGGIKKGIQAKKVVLYLSFFLLVLVLIYMGISKYSGEKKKDNIGINQITTSQDSKARNDEELPQKSEYGKEQNKEVVEKKEDYRNGFMEREVFPYDTLKNALARKDYSLIYDIAEKWKEKDVEISDKNFLSSAEELLKSEGVGYFYSIGLRKINEKNYSEASIELLKAYSLGINSYLYPHIIYMLGFSYEKLGEAERAIKYYESYINNYSSGNYIETVLYNTALLYENINLEKAKIYAKEIADRYPNSMYNNSRIGQILNR